MRWLKALLVALLMLLGLPAGATPGLGVAVSFEDTGTTDAEAAGSLWVGMEQGEEAARTILVTSLSEDTLQLLDFKIYDRIRVDGQLTTDYSSESNLSEWISFSPQSPNLAPGESVKVEMTFTIPLGAPDQAFDAVLRVLAGKAPESEDETAAGTKAIVGTQIAIDSELWLGLGDALDLAPDFEIAAVDGVLIDKQKYIRIYFQNNGIVSITPAGRLQLSDPAFADRVFEPIDFEAGEILEGQQGFVDVPVTEDVVDGFYRTFVTAESGGVRKTKLFEGNLVFDDPNLLTIPELALRIVMFVLASIGLVLGVRMLRRRKPQQPEPPTPEKVAPAPKTPKPGNKPATKKAAGNQAENKVAAAKKQVAKPRTSAPAKTSKKPATTKTAAVAKAKPTTAAIKQTQVEKVAPKPTQVAKTTRKTAPTSPRVRPQSKDTESK